jgi:Mor family transcriptional regulator
VTPRVSTGRWTTTNIKLTLDEARAILAARPPKVNGRYVGSAAIVKELRKKYRIAEKTITNIWNGANWGFLQNEDKDTQD